MQGHTHSTQRLALSLAPVFSPFTEQINIRVLDPFTIKPLDRNLILESARATKGRILTVEDHYYEGNSPGPESRGHADQGRARHLSFILGQDGSLGPGSPEPSLGAAGTWPPVGPRLGQGPSKLGC